MTAGAAVPPPTAPVTTRPARPSAVPLQAGLRGPSLVAGTGILLLAVLSGFGNFYAVDGLVTAGEAARTARDIAASETLFRMGIVSLVLAATVDVVVAWALWRLFSPVSEGLSALAAWFRLAYAAVFLVAVAQLLAALRPLHPDGGGPDSAGQVLAHVQAFNDIWLVGLVLFGAHLLLVGWLAHHSGFVPRWLAALIAVAGAGYGFDGIAAVLSNGSAPAVSTVTFAGEFVLGCWLLLRGRRLAGPTLGQ